MTIRAIGLTFTLLIEGHLEVLAAASSFHAVSTVTHDGLTICNPAPAMKQLPARHERVRRPWHVDLDPCGLKLWSLQPKLLIALFFFNWETSRFVIKKYVQQPFPPAGNGFVVNSGYDPFTVESNGKYWTVFECAVAPANQVSACIARLLPDLSGMDLSGLTVPALGISGPEPRETDPAGYPDECKCP
jgi:hypothetical protein